MSGWIKLPCPYLNRAGQCRFIAELTSLPVTPCGVTEEVCEACSRCDGPLNPLVATLALGVVVRTQPDRAEAFRRRLVRDLGDATPASLKLPVPGPETVPTAPPPRDADGFEMYPVEPSGVQSAAYIGMTEDSLDLGCVHRDPEVRRQHTCGGCAGSRRTLGVHLCRLHRRECTILASDAVCDVTGEKTLMCLTCEDKTPPEDPPAAA